ncbi:uncharacterized protein LOC107020131 isoform X2 [Solanum pennellii]|uniref:Uncharacterized protein LOC107020131 isoform X2 n=1 Tax=Solanum pennellii TaxID=28526 RepID=A0ABM1VAQ4_SOLPN|nr:uncharacterized protein LOC107020131 isoform X2 [Solanum pennellii]
MPYLSSKKEAKRLLICQGFALKSTPMLEAHNYEKYMEIELLHVAAVQVKASRDLPVEIAAIERKLAIVGDIVTCLKSCNVKSDCDDAWVCSDCAPNAFPGGYHCDVLTANGQGYYSTMLQARYNKQTL